MSVYIKGMEMPTSCGDCKAFVCYRQWAGDVGDCFCGITKNDAEAKEKNADCPLVPVPPHGDLIDRDPFIEFIKTHWDGYDQWVVGQLEARPTIIPAEEGEDLYGHD